MILRKWEWTEEQCRKRNFLNAAKIARKIDNALLECYTREHTGEWLFFSKTFDFDVLAPRRVFMDIVTNSVFCVACMDYKFCANCRFGIMTGDCGDPTSLYRCFLVEIYWVWSKEEKE